MKKILLFWLLLAAIPFAFCQNDLKRGPDIWLRADRSSESRSWSDVSGNGRDGVWSKFTEDRDGGLINFNPSYRVERENGLIFSDLPVLHSQATVLIVYQIDDPSREYGLWSLRLSEEKSIGLTSHRIIGDNSEISYADLSEKGTIINSLSQSWKSNASAALLQVGVNGEFDFEGKIAEFIYFNSTLPDEELFRWASYLAVKYGVTLHQSPYYDSDGTIVWDYDRQKEHSFSISGLGHDSGFGLEQRQTYACDGKMVIGLGRYSPTNRGNKETMQDGDYIMFGSKTESSLEQDEIYTAQGERLVSYGNIMMQATGMNSAAYSSFLQVDASGWEGPYENYYLLIDRSGSGNFSSGEIEYYQPLRVAEGILYYEDIHWDTDGNGKDIFCFAYVDSENTENEIRNYVQKNGNRNGRHSDDENFPGFEGSETSRYVLYPNPTAGHYTLKVHYPEARPLVVKIYTADGKLMKSFTGEGQSDYEFDDYVSTKGHYLFEIESGSEKKSLKMIVH